MEKSQGGTQVTFEWSERLFSSDTDHSFVELLQTIEHGRLLLMDGEVQFAESDEHRYHEMLVHPVMMVAKERSKVLILGGGDGLAAREVLKWDPRCVDIVDYDETFVRKVGMDLIRDLNKDSFFHEAVTYHCADAKEFLQKSSNVYDVILVDLPDPDGQIMEQLYKDVLMGCVRAIHPHGCLSVHVGGLVLSKEDPCWDFVRETRRMLEATFSFSKIRMRTATIPSFTNIWGFLYVVPREISRMVECPEHLTRYWDAENPAHTILPTSRSVLDKDILAYLRE
jgi:spermidine synthase